jgi:hypothetical protein
LNGNHIEFRTGSGKWRTLDDDDIQLHHLFRTEVSKWLQRETGNARRTGT